MIKLYRRVNSKLHYHEAWVSGSKIVEHWGEVGDRGQTREHKRDRRRSEDENLAAILGPAIADGYAEFDEDALAVLLIEYAVDGMGSGEDVKKRHAVEDRMNETLGWTGLGHCDGGSIGSGSMEVCCIVLDFEIAKQVIENDLKGTQFDDFTRICKE